MQWPHVPIFDPALPAPSPADAPLLVESFAEVGGGGGGYNANHEFFGYRAAL